VVTGLIVLVVVLAAASAAGLLLRQRQGRFHPGPAGQPSSPGDVLSAADLGAPLGAQATLVQFSTEVCAYCRPTRELLTEVARDRDGISFVEIDAAERMDLTRRLHVLSTPTVLVLDALGGIASRASGPLRKADLLTAVGAVLDADGVEFPTNSGGNRDRVRGLSGDSGLVSE
jgi:thiol-disulfide isomerase/thioredoxin